MSNFNQQFDKDVALVRRYHQQTKHRFNAYANGPETLDWSMQPNPFRNFEGAPKTTLPLLANQVQTLYRDLYRAGNVESQALNLASISQLLELSMGLSAWKEYQGERWALRCNPSSGNLHPTESYLVTAGIDSLSAGVYHYLSYDHSLEQRCRFESDIDETQDPILLVGLSSVFWREAWKYGERAYRYCQLDIGHAIAAIRYACAALGWSAEIVTTVSEERIAQLLGLNRDMDFNSAEREHPDLLVMIKTETSIDYSLELGRLLDASSTGTWQGHANLLDANHFYQWPIIEDVAEAARNTDDSCSQPKSLENLPAMLEIATELLASEIVRRRRSAQSFDGITSMSAQQFFRMADMLLARDNTPPWDALPWRQRIHPVFFIHRVTGLNPGLYILLRNRGARESIAKQLSEKMQWKAVEGAPEYLGLYCLIEANAQKAAAKLSCHQKIVSDSAFSVAMLSEFDAALNDGAWSYKHLYWEAGILGQVLYLEAEASDLRGTGIGCFFDDPVHEILGIKNTQLQSLYHFTVGGALDDSRLRTMMPYQHRE